MRKNCKMNARKCMNIARLDSRLCASSVSTYTVSGRGFEPRLGLSVSRTHLTKAYIGSHTINMILVASSKKFPAIQKSDILAFGCACHVLSFLIHSRNLHCGHICWHFKKENNCALLESLAWKRHQI